MPKDEFDFDDPMELNGVGFITDEDTTDSMCECFIEEFMRMGYGHRQILGLFRTPHYIGMNMVLQNRGEAFIQQKIEEIFLRWGRVIEPQASNPAANPSTEEPSIAASGSIAASCPTDPMGSHAPQFKI